MNWDALGKAMLKPERPMVATVAARLHQALTVPGISKIADQLVVGGIANTFIAAAGQQRRQSPLCEHDLIDTAKKLAAETNIPG